MAQFGNISAVQIPEQRKREIFKRVSERLNKDRSLEIQLFEIGDTSNPLSGDLVKYFCNMWTWSLASVAQQYVSGLVVTRKDVPANGMEEIYKICETNHCSVLYVLQHDLNK
eukprot:Gb_25964 [translate_table: standard]